MSIVTIGIIMFCIVFWPNILGAMVFAGTMIAGAAVATGALIASPFIFMAGKLQARKTQKALEARKEAIQARR